MFDLTKFNEMVPSSQFTYWFLRSVDGELRANGIWDIIEVASRKPIGEYFDKVNVVHLQSGDNSFDDAIKRDFEKFKTRPEYAVGHYVEDLVSMSLEAKVTMFETLLVGIEFLRSAESGHNPDDSYARVENCLNWLRQTDFYRAPASTQYHESYAGGLLHHSLCVYNRCIELMKSPAFSNVNCTSAALVALVHDWCKIGLYEQYNRNVKNEDTGKWEQVVAFRHNQTGVPLGHGVSSMFLANKCFRLSVEEALAIRWHMAAWRVVDSEMNELQMANEKYPLVHLIQFADQLAIVSY